jgi:hypothetical protein
MTHRCSRHSELTTDGAYSHALCIQVPNRRPRFHAKHPFWFLLMDAVPRGLGCQSAWVSFQAQGGYFFRRNQHCTTGLEAAVSERATRPRSRRLGNGQMFSVAGLFRERYGHVARPLEVPAARNPAPVAGIVVSASPATVLAGDPLGVEVRFVDPATGRTLTPDQPDVLFAPPARVFAVISQTADPNQGLTIELDPVDYGAYRVRPGALRRLGKLLLARLMAGAHLTRCTSLGHLCNRHAHGRQAVK